MRAHGVEMGENGCCGFGLRRARAILARGGCSSTAVPADGAVSAVQSRKPHPDRALWRGEVRRTGFYSTQRCLCADTIFPAREGGYTTKSESFVGVWRCRRPPAAIQKAAGLCLEGKGSDREAWRPVQVGKGWASFSAMWGARGVMSNRFGRSCERALRANRALLGL